MKIGTKWTDNNPTLPLHTQLQRSHLPHLELL